MHATTREPLRGVWMAGARVRRVGVVLALVVGLFAVPFGIGASTASASVPTKCCLPIHPVTLGLFPTSGPQFSAVQVFGNCGVAPPSDAHLYAFTWLQNYSPNPHPPPNAQYLAQSNTAAAADGSYNDDLTWDLNQMAIPGRWYFGFAWCDAYKNDDTSNPNNLEIYVGPSAAAWFCVTGPNVPTCSINLSSAALEVAVGLGSARAYMQGWLQALSPASAPGSNAPPPTQPPPPPPTRPSRPPSSSTTTTSTTTTTTTTTTPPRRVPG